MLEEGWEGDDGRKGEDRKGENNEKNQENGGIDYSSWLKTEHIAENCEAV